MLEPQLMADILYYRKIVVCSFVTAGPNTRQWAKLLLNFSVFHSKVNSLGTTRLEERDDGVCGGGSRHSTNHFSDWYLGWLHVARPDISSASCSTLDRSLGTRAVGRA